ncbi:unnamed protein product [Psylliodes chrysocephalus]|uniref:Myb/SANT-like DNA-binding domain-containing protein n=1 Tax=Psylliodes chrysocephalus TaxID=3402493 RepID=A0A9P0GN05_9CUCU|nr:unnamed protein product [Psylliodes chrysocephala]
MNIANHQGETKNMTDLDMSEFILINPIEGSQSQEYHETTDSDEMFFNRDRTVTLLNLYKTYKPKVALGKIKTIKRMWEIISTEISNKLRITIGPTKCKNRFKVLDRGYKKFTDNNRKTGRGRKTFDYENQFDQIYHKKVNIEPTILLSSKTISVNPEKPPSTMINEEIPNDKPSTSQSKPVQIPEVATCLQVNSKRRNPRISYQKRNEILVEIKNDLKNYYKEKLEVDREKLQLKKDKEERKRRKLNIENSDEI